MKKIDALLSWLEQQTDWVRLQDVPHEKFGMSRHTTAGRLRDLCASGRAELQVIDCKLYRAKHHQERTEPVPSRTVDMSGTYTPEQWGREDGNEKILSRGVSC